jgi:hypothetical protein
MQKGSRVVKKKGEAKMQASSQRTTGQVRLALMLIVGVAAAATCVVTLMLWKAPVASAQEEGPTGDSFVVTCGFSHEKQVDPIVDFGEPGTPEAVSDHVHHFFGNTTTDSDSTLESLRAAASQPDGGTTCPTSETIPPGEDAPLGDTAAYWIPTVSWTDSSGTTGPIQATQTFFYYKLGGKSAIKGVNPQPPGLKIVTVQGKNVDWRCQNGNFSTSPPKQCSNGKLVVRIKFPDCLAVDSNGQALLDTRDEEGNTLHVPDDHRSHMADSVESQNGGVKKCPSTHPYPVPMLQLNFQFPIPTTRGHVTLSSDHEGDRPGSTMHADFFNAWQEGALEDLVARCINGGPFTTSHKKPTDCS